jgi:hypothetical protein
MSKEDAPNFRMLQPDHTCGDCKHGKKRGVSWFLYQYEGVMIDCQKYDFTLCCDKDDFICDSWEGE